MQAKAFTAEMTGGLGCAMKHSEKLLPPFPLHSLSILNEQSGKSQETGIWETGGGWPQCPLIGTWSSGRVLSPQGKTSWHRVSEASMPGRRWGPSMWCQSWEGGGRGAWASARESGRSSPHRQRLGKAGGPGRGQFLQRGGAAAAVMGVHPTQGS